MNGYYYATYLTITDVKLQCATTHMNDTNDTNHVAHLGEYVLLLF